MSIPTVKNDGYRGVCQRGEWIRLRRILGYAYQHL